MKEINLLTPHDFGRHGEIILKKIDKIPSTAKLIEKSSSLIIGHSKTGHHHIAVAEREQTVELYEDNKKVYLSFLVDTRIEHQKESEAHKTQVFKSGCYVREIREVYSYAEKQMKRVRD
jgi:hypothetical protein